MSDDRNPQDNLQAIIGDLDSLTPDAREHFTKPKPAVAPEAQPPHQTQIVHSADQYSTDFTKSVRWVRERLPVGQSAVDIVAIGGLGGRVDQGLSQLHHLYMFQTDPRYAEGRMYLFSGESLTFLLKAGSHRIRVRGEPGQEGREDVFGKHVGILPVREPSRITTKGLEWDVTDWQTEFGGQVSTSNHVLPETQVVEVSTTRDVLFTIALK